MSELTMGPLKAKQKKEGKATVFRCGILDCSEKLVESRHDGIERFFRVSAGYLKNGSGVYIKTRRPPVRDSASRQFAKDAVEAENPTSDLADFLKRFGQQEHESLDSLTERFFEERDEEKERNEFPRKRIEDDARSHPHLRTHNSDFLGVENLPLIFKCARCGNLSKISV